LIPWQRLAEPRCLEGPSRWRCSSKATEFVIRLGPRALMSSGAHGSEEALAELACAGIADIPDARVLIGGLGWATCSPRR
jgi:hypothetical protein